MGLLTQFFSKPARVSLELERGRLLLRCSYGDRAAPYADLLARWPQLSELKPFFPRADAPSAVLDVGRLPEARELLESLKARYQKAKLLFEVAEPLRRVAIRQRPPAGFQARYVREKSGLRRYLPKGAQVLEGGWLLQGEACWRLKKPTPAALTGLSREEIPAGSLVAFLRDELPALTAAGLPAQCEIAYDATPAVTLELFDVREDSVGLRPVWNVLPSLIDASVALPGHVLAAGVVQPGASPEELRPLLPRADAPHRLTGTDVAVLLDRFSGAWRPWITGDTAAFERLHRWAEAPLRWSLRARPGEQDGARRPMAEPVARIGADRVTVPELQQAMTAPYWRFPSGWARREELHRLGLDGQGRIAGKASAAPFPLTANQLLRRGDARLDGLWSEVETDGPVWIERADKHACAAAHLAYLTGWGLHGGLTGGYEALLAYGLPFLARQTRERPGLSVLILGWDADVRALQALPEGALGSARLLPYQQLGQDARARHAAWDLLILLEPDEYAGAAERQIALRAANLNARQTLGFFCRHPLLAGAERQDLAAGLLRHKDSPDVLRFLVRDARESLALPEPYRFIAPLTVTRKPAPAEVAPPAAPDDHAAEITLPGPQPRGVPVPPRVRRAAPVPGISGKGQRFLMEARKLAGYAPASAAPAPFARFAPVYADMSPEQKEWYFYLRSKWRAGEYPDADVGALNAYLHVHIYELIGQVGVRDAEDGYRQLLALWRGNRAKVPVLDNCLGDWICDYIHTRDCGVTDERLLADAPSLSPRSLDAAMAAMAKQPRLELPLWALERLSGYRISASKFYQRDHQRLMETALPGAVAALDQQLRDQTGKGLLDTYAPLKLQSDQITPFTATPMAENTQYTLRLRRYETCQPLAEYLRNAVRETENLLRARFKFPSKLQGVKLDDQARACIARYLNALLPAAQGESPASPAPPAPARITLDLSQLAQLRDESDAVRAALLATTGQNEPAAGQAKPAPPKNKPAPPKEEGARSPSPWQAFFNGADAAALRAVMEGEAALAAYAKARRQMPDVTLDALNTLAQDTIGDLIADAQGVLEEYADIVKTYLEKGVIP